jgi:hypothetical protein
MRLGRRNSVARSTKTELYTISVNLEFFEGNAFIQSVRATLLGRSDSPVGC